MRRAVFLVNISLSLFALSLPCRPASAYEKPFPTVTTIRKTYPSIVEIEARAETLADNAAIENRPRSFLEKIFIGKNLRPAVLIKKGVGVAVSGSGTVVTNAHILKDMTDITVILRGGERLKAKTAGSFPEHDLAFIKIDPRPDLPAMKISPSALLKRGDEVFTVGNSRLLKRVTIHGRIIDFVYAKIGLAEDDRPVSVLNTRFDAHSYRGDSGSPVFDKRGRFIGILFASLADSAYYSVVLPSDLIKKDLGRLPLAADRRSK